MKHAYLKDLQSRLLGSVSDAADALDNFSTDQSIYQATPTAVVYPQNTADVRKTVQFVAERAANGKPLQIVPRGKGSDQVGGAVGEGLQLVFPAHMNKLLRLDQKTVTVQPGIIFETLQQTLYTHGRYIPQTPSGAHFSTVGGLVASDTGGQNSLKYGTIRQAVRKLKVVLSDGSIIETNRISARELNRRKGFSTLEGELYRKFDSLLLDNADLIQSRRLKTAQNSAGYDLWSVRGPGGTFDLSQVIIGSQGTLGIITEITLTTTPYNPRTTLLVGFFDTVTGAGEAVRRLREYEPSAIELVDRHLLEFSREHNPGDLEGLIPEKIPAIVLLVEFDNYSQFAQRLRSARAERLMRRHSGVVRVSTDPVEQVALWKIRQTAVANWLSHGPKKALPFIEDAAVPVEKLPQYIEKTYKLLAAHDLEPALWGHAGTGNIRLQPRLDLARPKDVDKLIAFTREYLSLVSGLGGTPSGSHNDSLLRGAQLAQLYGEEFYELLVSTKHIFDPHGIFNPSKKTGSTEEYVRAHLRAEFSRKHLHDYLVYT
jgi:FAD/FMN-containing dehydrogenase